MAKTVSNIVLFAALLLLSACLSTGSETTSKGTTLAEQKQRGAEIAAEEYEVSKAKELEIARAALNITFKTSRGAFDRYADSLVRNDVVTINQTLAAMASVETEAEKQQIWARLSPEEQKIVTDHINSEEFKSVMKDLGVAAAQAALDVMQFQEKNKIVDFGDLNFIEKMQETNKVNYSWEQVKYLQEVIILSHRNNQIIEAFINAQ